MKAKIHDTALLELEEATAYYTAKSRTVAVDFEKEVEDYIGKAALHPRRGRQMGSPDMRAAELRRFPYRILYAIEENTVFILSVANIRRANRDWKDRLKDFK